MVMNSSRKKILIAIDGSRQAGDAARYASTILPPRHTEVVLFHVGTEIPEFLWDLTICSDSGWMRKTMDDWKARQDQLVKDSMQTAKGCFIAAGFPEESLRIKIQERTSGITRHILAEAQDGYTAVIVGRTGMAGLIGVKIGSVTEKLIDKMGHHTPSGVTLMVVDGKPDPGKILIGFDGSQGAQKAVSFVASLLRGTDHHVTLCQIIRAFKMDIYGHDELVAACRDHPFPEEIEMKLRHPESRITGLIEDAERSIRAAGLIVDNMILYDYTSRSFGLVEEARKGGYGTIVLGRKGVSAVKEFFIGRVGKKVLQLADNMTVCIVND